MRNNEVVSSNQLNDNIDTVSVSIKTENPAQPSALKAFFADHWAESAFATVAVPTAMGGYALYAFGGKEILGMILVGGTLGSVVGVYGGLAVGLGVGIYAASQIEVSGIAALYGLLNQALCVGAGFVGGMVGGGVVGGVLGALGTSVAVVPRAAALATAAIGAINYGLFANHREVTAARSQSAEVKQQDVSMQLK